MADLTMLVWAGEEMIPTTRVEDLPFPPEDNVTWRFPKEEVPKGTCGMEKNVRLASNHRFVIVCHLPQGHDLPHEGIHRWYSGARQ